MDFDDIRDLLAAAKLSDISGQGATEDVVSGAEKRLGILFPSSYRQFLKTHGWGYFGSLELICGLGSDIPDEWEPGTNVVRVVEDERNGPLRFPLEVIPISQNGAGDWYALDCSQILNGEAPIVFVAHEVASRGGFSSSPCAHCFADWVYSRLSDAGD